MNKFKKVVLATISTALVAGAVAASAQSASCFQFTQNMNLGKTSSEVLQLQKTLNAMGFTVSTTGLGSAGMETNYFGAKTKAAAIKFQAANNIIQTGNVYALTRAALNAKCGTVVVPPTGTSTPTSGSVSVALASAQPNNVLVAGSVNATLANYVFSGNGSVVSVKLQRTGASNNDAISNVYLYDTYTGARLTDAASVLTDGTVTFANGTGLFTVAGSRAITVKADIAALSNGISTSGQSVGFSLAGYTVSGATAAVVSGVNGPVLPIGSAAIVAVTVSTTTSVSTSVDAGRQNVTFWEGNVLTSKDSYMSGGIFSFVGSAPTSAFANVKLYVDGVQVGNAMSVDAAGKVSLIGSSFIKAGTHTISLRGDVVSGAGRDYYVRLEDGGLMFEDANIRGTYGAITLASGVSLRTPISSSVSINSCSTNNCSIYNADSSFSGLKVVAGATNQTIGKYTFKAIGEPVKLVSGSLAIAGASTTLDIRNVGIYVDGVQVVSGKTVSLNGTTYVTLTNLGSMIVPMGNTSVIEVKADIMTLAGAALPSGSLTTKLSLDVQGQDSKNSTTYISKDSNPVNVGTMSTSFANNSNFTGSKVTSNASNVKVGSFLLSTGNEGVRLTGLNVAFTAGGSLNLANVNNFVLKDGDTQIWNQSTIGTVVNTSPYIEIPANTTKTFDVYVSFNNAVDGNTLSVTGTASYQGLVSLTSVTSGATAAQLTTVATPALASTVKASSALSDRYVTGGTLNNVANFTLTATGSTFTTSKMQVTVSNPAVVSAVNIAGVNAIYRGNGIYSADVSKDITTIGTDVAVNVTFNTANRDTNTLSGATTTVKLTYVNSGAAGFVAAGTEDSSATTLGTSSEFTLVGAYPTVKISGNTNTVSPGTFNNVNLGTVTISPVGGTVSVTTFGINLPTGITSARIVDSTGNVVTNAALSGQIAGAQTVTISPVSNISTPVSYTIQGSGTNGGTVSTVMGASLGAVSTLTWNDVSGSSSVTPIAGSNLLPNYNN